MTLLDAPTYDPVKARTRKNLLIAGLVTCVVLAGFLWYFWDWPQEHRVNQFFAAIEAKDLPKAFGIWNHDPDWQQHPQQYAPYPYGRFETDWGTPATGATSGRIRSRCPKRWAPGWWLASRSTDKRRPSFYGCSAATRQSASRPCSLRQTNQEPLRTVTSFSTLAGSST
jgi:hypothetical protein